MNLVPREFRCIKFIKSNETDFLSQTWFKHVYMNTGEFNSRSVKNIPSKLSN